MTKYKAFDMFGVEVYEKGLDNRTRYQRTVRFEGIKEAIEYARNLGSAGYTYKFVTWDCNRGKMDCID